MESGPNDDELVGRLLTRREALALLAGLGGTAVLAACSTSSGAQPTAARPTVTQPAGPQPTAGQLTATPNAEAATAGAATPVAASPTADVAAVADCVVKPEMTEGPFFVDEELNRSDVRPDTATGVAAEGVPLALAFVVSQVAGNQCTPLQGAQVDIWHCDAAGTYSDVGTAAGHNFLRGYQLSDAQGGAAFTTIFPGWYPGRAVHIHFKLRTAGADGGAYEFTSQLFFDEAITDTVHAQAPYARRGRRNTLNSDDMIYSAGGDQLLLKPIEANGQYSAVLRIALDLADAVVGADDGAGGPP
jgi:protocatechuate 3,4-dioxygenase beta subunit